MSSAGREFHESLGRTWPCVVAGAGAAGMTAAIFAARRGAEVLLLETRPKPGAKIRVSGGGRCNVLPSAVCLDDFHTAGSRHALRNVLFSWPLAEVRRFFESELGVPLYEEEDTGKLFPRSDRAQDVLEALLRECARLGVTLVSGSRVEVIERAEGGGARFLLAAAGGRCVRARAVVLATGGKSLPRSGSDGHGYEIAAALGHDLVSPYPALVPLRSRDGRWTRLAGISLTARLRAVRGERLVEEREGELLFTHRGFSGPVVLDMSRHVTAPGGEGVRLLVSWGGTRREGWESLLRAGGKGRTLSAVRAPIPRRLAEELVAVAGVEPDSRLSDLRREERLRLVQTLDAFELPVAGSEGYATAEVTGGGVPLEEVSVGTLESRKTPGLFFAGEILDVTGRIGGYNFLWAWVSGRKAGAGAAECDRASRR